MNYEEWLEAVPEEIKGDRLWTVTAYKLALFSADLGWRDVTKLMHDKRTQNLAGQLYRSLGSISANIAEGYSQISSASCSPWCLNSVAMRFMRI